MGAPQSRRLLHRERSCTSTLPAPCGAGIKTVNINIDAWYALHCGVTSDTCRVACADEIN